MSFTVQKTRYFPVTIGTVCLYLSNYQITQSSSVRETGSAEGGTVLTGCWGTGARIKLTGQLAPDIQPADVVCALAEQMLQPQALVLQKLVFSEAMLCGYTVAEKQAEQAAEITLLFYSSGTPGISGNPENPENPDDSGNSENPENPENPDDSGNSENPENPENPDDSGNSENPENPENPDDSGNSENPENPENPDDSGNSENSENSGNPENQELSA